MHEDEFLSMFEFKRRLTVSQKIVCILQRAPDTLKINQTHLAEVIGATRPYTNRILHALHDGKVIQLDGQNIKIVDRERLFQWG